MNRQSTTTNPQPLPDTYGDTLEPGTEVIFVGDKRLAAALIAVGVHLRKDPPYVQVIRPDGSTQTIFHFLPLDSDGVLNTTELIKAWGQDLDFIQANPLHPFTFAMCALRNYQSILEHLQNDVPWVQFEGMKDGKKVNLLVKKGSRKEEAARKRGLRQF